jgi:hypothetical protein
LIAQSDPSTSSGTEPAHLECQATGIGGPDTSLKLTEQIITDLLCCLNVFQRNLPVHHLLETGSKPRGFWHLTLCTLLSSQGSDAPDFTPYGCRSGALPLLHFPLCSGPS